MAATASPRMPSSWSQPDELAELLEPTRPDARYCIELIDGLEGAMLLAVREDLLGRHGTDPRKRIELLQRCAVEVHGVRRWGQPASWHC